MTTSLVTGGAGFIGSHVAEQCLSMGHRVVVLDDLSGGFRDNVPEGAEFVEGSVCDRPLVRRLFEDHQFDVVYHTAAYAAEGLSHFIRLFNYENNLLGSVTLINEVVRSGRVRRFVFASSIAVYGAGQLPMKEEQEPHPEDPYGIAKRAVELDLQAAHAQFGLDSTIFRLHNVYGERQCLTDRFRNVVGIFMSQLLNGEAMTVFGDGRQTRAFTYVGDVAAALVGSAGIEELRNEVVNIGSDEVTSVLDLAYMVAAALEMEPKLRFLPGRNEVKHAYSAHSKSRRLFGEYATTSLRAGIRRMAGWALRGGSPGSIRTPTVEVVRNLPPSWERHLYPDPGN